MIFSVFMPLSRSTAPPMTSIDIRTAPGQRATSLTTGTSCDRVRSSLLLHATPSLRSTTDLCLVSCLPLPKGFVLLHWPTHWSLTLELMCCWLCVFVQMVFCHTVAWTFVHWLLLLHWPTHCSLTSTLLQVGFYQIAKLCVIPFVCVVEYLVYSRSFSHSVILSIALVVLGVAVVTVSSVAVNWVGLNVAVLSIVAAGSQQLLCRHFQTSLKITSNEMLLFTAWPMAVFLLVIGPLLDWAITGGWVFQYGFTPAAATVIMSSCALAIGVNLSQFACLGRFSAVAYQVWPLSCTPLSMPSFLPCIATASNKQAS